MIEVKHGVELTGQRGEKVVTLPLRIRSVNDTDGTFQARILQCLGRRVSTKRQQEVSNSSFEEECLVSSAKSESDLLSLRWAIPVIGRGNGAGVGGEADVSGIVSIALANELANVQFAALSHLRCARVAEVRIVRPDHDAWLDSLLPQMIGQGVN